MIASEYASIFALLGVQVTMIDSSERPLRFLDKELTNEFCEAFQDTGGTYRGDQNSQRSLLGRLSPKSSQLWKTETPIESEKLLVALGRIANIKNSEY